MAKSYAYEPHNPKDHKYEESIYQNSKVINSKVITLQEAINLGLEFSPEVKSSKDGIAAAQSLEKQAGYWSNPNFEIEAANIAGTGPYTGSDSAEYTYSLSKSIDISGKRYARKNAATQAKNAATQGDFELAVQLLDKAKQECQLSRQQAAQQNELVDLVPYYLK